MIPLAKPVIGESEEQQVLEVLRSGRLSLGPKLAEFEQSFGGWLGVDHASAVSSGTAGLHLALRAVGVKAGDEVITSPFSFIASSNAVLYQRAKPVFVDIDPVTLNIPTDAVAEAITERTTALLPVHIFGAPADVPAMEQLGFPIVEDACEALGAVHSDGTQVGARGHHAVFGFYANKQLTTGEGGIVISPSSSAKAEIDSERNQGRAPDMAWLDHDRLGFNYRLSDLQCALGIAQVQRLDHMLGQRMRVAELYADALSGADGLELPPVDLPTGRRSWFVYVVKVPEGVNRDQLIKRLYERGVEAKPYLPAIHLFEFYREQFGFKQGQFPVAEDAASRSLALPFFPELSEAEVDTVARTLISELQAVAV